MRVDATVRSRAPNFMLRATRRGAAPVACARARGFHADVAVAVRRAPRRPTTATACSVSAGAASRRWLLRSPQPQPRPPPARARHAYHHASFRTVQRLRGRELELGRAVAGRCAASRRTWRAVRRSTPLRHKGREEMLGLAMTQVVRTLNHNARLPACDEHCAGEDDADHHVRQATRHARGTGRGPELAAPATGACAG